MASHPTPPLYQQVLDHFDGLATSLAGVEPAFLAEARQHAMAYFRTAGFPTTRSEEWKYTNLAPYLREGYALNGQAGPPVPGVAHLLDAAAVPDLDCYRVFLLNGHLQVGAGPPLPPFMKIRRLAEAFSDPAFEAYFGREVETNHYPFAALNTALFGDGLLLEIEAHAHLDKPLHLVHAYASAGNHLVQPRHLVVVQPYASLNLIESVVADNDQGHVLVNAVTEIALAENSRLDHYTLQKAQAGLVHLQHTEVSQQRDSVYSSYTFSLPGAALWRNNLHVRLKAAHTESHLYGFYLAANGQLVDNHTLMDHQMPHCESNEIYKGVLLDTATGVFNGKVFVQPDAQKTNAFQQNNNLLLSPRAVINSKPQLEIYADDVKCSHGSTTGQLSPEALFYLRSRGIGEAAARALLVQAFAFDVTGQVKIPKLRGYINQLITNHLSVHQQVANA